MKPFIFIGGTVSAEARRVMGDLQHFCLRWNNYQNSITTAFENLRDDEDFIDVTLACDGKSLKAHRVVLSACSPYFRELLKVSIFYVHTWFYYYLLYVSRGTDLRKRTCLWKQELYFKKLNANFKLELKFLISTYKIVIGSLKLYYYC